jgi:hypothetical protein
VKVARKYHEKKDENAVNTFKKNFGKICKEIALDAVRSFDSVNLFFGYAEPLR